MPYKKDYVPKSDVDWENEKDNRFFWGFVTGVATLLIMSAITTL